MSFIVTALIINNLSLVFGQYPEVILNPDLGTELLLTRGYIGFEVKFKFENKNFQKCTIKMSGGIKAREEIFSPTERCRRERPAQVIFGIILCSRLREVYIGGIIIDEEILEDIMFLVECEIEGTIVKIDSLNIYVDSK